MELRPFQEEVIAGVRASLARNRFVMLQCPTGAGKTVMASFITRATLAKGGRPWFLANRDYLVEQTSQTFDGMGIGHGLIAAGRRFNPYQLCQVCSIDTLKNRLLKIPQAAWPTVVLVDEAAHSAAGGWARVLEWAELVGAKVIGLTATPERLDGKPLNPPYTDIVLGPSVSWLIGEGYLSGYRAFAPTSPVLADAKSRGGDYAIEDIEDEMDRPTLTGDIVGHYLRIARGKRAIYFCVSIAHSKHVADAFLLAGVSAVHLDGSTPSGERKSAARAMADGRIDVICNAALVSEGWDLAAQAGKDVTVECVGLLRPTKSLALYLQQVGRALRKKAEPAIILDHAGNIQAHGLPDDDRVWSLSGRKKDDQAAEVAVSVCKSCFASFRAVLKTCPECGAVKPVAESMPRAISIGDGELEEVDPVVLRQSRQKQEASCRSIIELVALAKERGLSEPNRWAHGIWKMREKKAQYVANKRAEAHLRG